MADQVIQRSGLAGITAQPRALGIALDQPAPLQHPAEAFGDALHQRLGVDELHERLDRIGGASALHMPVPRHVEHADVVKDQQRESTDAEPVEVDAAVMRVGRSHRLSIVILMSPHAALLAFVTATELRPNTSLWAFSLDFLPFHTRIV